MREPKQGRGAAAGPAGAPTTRLNPERTSRAPSGLLFTRSGPALVQGTGKTHSVLGLLAALLSRTGLGGGGAKIAAPVKGAKSLPSLTCTEGRARTADEHARADAPSERHSRVGAPESGGRPPRPSTPRVLLCAPSNCAVDELVARLLERGVLSASGGVSRPRLVRLGPQEAMSEASRSVSLEVQVERMVAGAEAGGGRGAGGGAAAGGGQGGGKGGGGGRGGGGDGGAERWRLRKRLLSEAQVVACTLSGSGMDALQVHPALPLVTTAVPAADPLPASPPPAAARGGRQGARLRRRRGGRGDAVLGGRAAHRAAARLHARGRLAPGANPGLAASSPSTRPVQSPTLMRSAPVSGQCLVGDHRQLPPTVISRAAEQ